MPPIARIGSRLRRTDGCQTRTGSHVWSVRRFLSGNHRVPRQVGARGTAAVSQPRRPSRASPQHARRPSRASPQHARRPSRASPQHARRPSRASPQHARRPSRASPQHARSQAHASRAQARSRQKAAKATKASCEEASSEEARRLVPTTPQPESSQRERSEAQNARIRDTAKWLVGSFAAVGAALLAGVQLSNLGKLPACIGDKGCGRFWLALLALVLGLAGVGWAIWLAAKVMTRSRRSVDELKDEYEDQGSHVRRYFDGNKSYLQGFKGFDDLIDQESLKYGEFDRLSAEFDKATAAEQEQLVGELDAKAAELDDLLARSDAVISVADQVSFSTYFRDRALRGIMIAALVAGLGLACLRGPPTQGSLRFPRLRFLGPISRDPTLLVRISAISENAKRRLLRS